MTLKTQMVSDMSVFINTDEFATAIIYAGSSINAIVDYGNAAEDNIFQSDHPSGSTVDVCEIEVKVADVASPAYRDEVVIGSTTWYMRKIISGDGITWLLRLETDERPVL
jgi:hypothetical protein